ncbi:probable LRR receptor-like serine/threonine-protein kinase At3g47570 [Punica granatum]|uniref:Probable LRR receptor-like serine/threonine-protein kinase At3g47570 n=1 Tax=Punica granatum TaxID=22663 RepID=A0A6P8DKS7_PUNGR|nr:probable LRR receptor-like serine/threonine-protein kinase At3g47570 [Punica granatum]
MFEATTTMLANLGSNENWKLHSERQEMSLDLLRTSDLSIAINMPQKDLCMHESRSMVVMRRKQKNPLGVLPSNEQTVAIKVLKLEEQGASKSFIAECRALRTIQHQNILKTITSFSAIDFRGEDFKALVFKFMPKGSLEKWSHPTPNESGRANNTTTVSIVERLSIAIDVAPALEYLHHQGQTPIVHCDLKLSNFLLDSDFLAHLSDFGLAKSVGIRGTVGCVQFSHIRFCSIQEIRLTWFQLEYLCSEHQSNVEG